MPDPVLTDERKSQLIKMEVERMYEVLGNGKGYDSHTFVHGGYPYTILCSLTDPDSGEKKIGVHTAVRTIVDNGFALPDPLRVYCSEDRRVQNRCFHRDTHWNDVCWITLGSTAASGGSVQSISRNPPVGHTHASVTCIHEIGHHLHETSAGDVAFHGTGSPLRGTAQTAGQVSAYACNTKKEFVAEVFAGMNCGMTFSRAVMEEYRALGGPTSAKLG